MTRGTVALFVCAALLYGCAEIVSIVGLEHISKIHRRILAERTAAEKIRPAAPGQPKTVLFVSNSLLLEGLDLPSLQRQTAAKLQVHRYVIEGTNFYDWYYGLRRLFHLGMHPDAVVLCLNTDGLLVKSIRGDFSARILFDAADIWSASRSTNANLTTTTSLYLAHASNFYATRNVLRGVLMGKIAPNIATMWLTLIFSKAKIPSDAVATPVMREHLALLKQLCDENGVKVSFLIAPTAQPGELAALTAGKQAGVLVLRPVPNYSLGNEFYQDSFHLNTRGAELFTNRLAEEMMDPKYP